MFRTPASAFFPLLLALALETGTAQGAVAWSEPSQVTGLSVVTAGKANFCEVTLAGGAEFAFPVDGGMNEIMAHFLLTAFRESGRVRILSDPQVVVLYHVEHATDTRRRPKVLGVRMVK